MPEVLVTYIIIFEKFHESDMSLIKSMGYFNNEGKNGISGAYHSAVLCVSPSQSVV
jgi:hypothetical protein